MSNAIDTQASSQVQPQQDEPVRAGRASEDIALRLEAAILDGSFRPGDRLPSEREMQIRFGTGRGVVREAIKMLKQKGLLEVRKGSKGGAYVRELEVTNISESLALFLKQHPMSPDSVIEFRESMDRTITQLALSHGTQEEKDDLVAGAEELHELLVQETPDLIAIGDLDRDLNLRLARMARNPLFEWVMGALQMGFGSHDYAMYEDRDFRVMAAANWVDTARAIALGDPMRALSYVTNHYNLLRRCVDGKAGRKTEQFALYVAKTEE